MNASVQYYTMHFGYTTLHFVQISALLVPLNVNSMVIEFQVMEFFYCSQMCKVS